MFSNSNFQQIQNKKDGQRGRVIIARHVTSGIVEAKLNADSIQNKARGNGGARVHKHAHIKKNSSLSSCRHRSITQTSTTVVGWSHFQT